MSRWACREDSYAGTWESAGFGQDDHAVNAGDVAFDEVLGGRISLPAFNCLDGVLVGMYGGGWWSGSKLHTWLVVPSWNMQVRSGRLRVHDVYVVGGTTREEQRFEATGRTHLVNHVGNQALHLIVFQTLSVHASLAQANCSAKFVNSDPCSSFPLLV